MQDTNQPVLVIDDFVTMTRIMKSIVIQLGFADVDTCHSGQAALAQLNVVTSTTVDPNSDSQVTRRTTRTPDDTAGL